VYKFGQASLVRFVCWCLRIQATLFAAA
jgi:hypothetical protein